MGKRTEYLEDKLAKKREIIAALKGKLKEAEYLEDKLAKKTDIIAALKAKLAEAEDALLETQESNQELQKRMSIMEKYYCGYIDRNRQEIQSLKETAKEVAAKDKKIVELETKLKNTEKENIDLQTKMADLTKKHSNKIAYMKVWLNQESERRETVLVQKH